MKKAKKKKATESTRACHALVGGEGGHDVGAGAAEELGDGDDLVAAGAEGVDEDGQGGDSGGAVSRRHRA